MNINIVESASAQITVRCCQTPYDHIYICVNTTLYGHMASISHNVLNMNHVMIDFNHSWKVWVDLNVPHYSCTILRNPSKHLRIWYHPSEVTWSEISRSQVLTGDCFHHTMVIKLLHSLGLVAIGLSTGYETWPPIDLFHNNFPPSG